MAHSLWARSCRVPLHLRPRDCSAILRASRPKSSSSVGEEMASRSTVAAGCNRKHTVTVNSSGPGQNGHNFVYNKANLREFESCDLPIVQKRPIWVKIGDVLSRVTLKFDGWPWKTIGHLPFAALSFVQHFIAIGEFKLELQSRNAQFGSNSMNFRAVWPWNLTADLEKQ